MDTSVTDFLDVSETERDEIQKYEKELYETDAMVKTCEDNTELLDCVDKYQAKLDYTEAHLKELIQIAVLRNRSEILKNKADTVSENMIPSPAHDDPGTERQDMKMTYGNTEQQTPETAMRRYYMVELESILDVLSEDGKLELIKRAKELSQLPQYRKETSSCP